MPRRPFTLPALLARGMLLLVLLMAAREAMAAGPVSFSLSSSKTFSPNQKPSIHLYARNVDQLEFRIYRVEDPLKFLTHLRELHSFENDTPWAAKEQIDERTWLERFHDWKHHLWYQLRQFFRGQFSSESRDKFRAKQASLARRSRIVGVAQFAQIPLLNDKQLVARWQQEMPPTFVSDSQDLPVDPLPSGLYLVEATDGHYKAYTVIVVSEMALVTRTTPGSILAFCVDRHSGTPIAGAQLRFGFGNEILSSVQADSDGLAQLKTDAPKQERDNLWAMATNGKEVAIVTPQGYSFSSSESSRWAAYVYTDRPVYRPGHTVHWKAILRERVENHLALPKPQNISVKITDDKNHEVFSKEMGISAAGTVMGDFELSKSAPLGDYTIQLGETGKGVVEDFRVEEYRKPEYQVRVNPAKMRTLQGETMQVTIDSRYFFGEPVANAKVKYSVYHSPHYWWEEENDSDANGMGGNASAEGDESDNSDSEMYGADQQSEQTGRLDANGKLTITVPTQMEKDPRRIEDQDYTIEAAVTDEANREISGHGHFLASYGSFRIHVEPASYALQKGSPAVVNVTAVDYDDKPVQTSVHLQLTSRRWADGKTETTRGAQADVTTDAAGKAQVSLPVDKSGGIEVEAAATTPEKRVVRDSTWIWVMGGSDEEWFGANSTSAQIVADKKTYAPGDTAHLSILSQTAGFDALVVATGDSVQLKKVLSSEGKTLSFDLPITSDSQPNLEVSAVFLKDDVLYEARKEIKVPPLQEQLKVTITPAKDIFQPQQQATYDVAATDWQGHAVSADLSFGVVDEAIYSIHPDTSGDMVRELYPSRSVNAAIDSSLEYYFSGLAGTRSPLLAERKTQYRPQMAQVKPGNDVAQPRVRKAFPDTAFWAPAVHTDAQGHARVSLNFPDSLTTWRATVRAVTAESQAGSAVNRVIVRKNILVRMGTPRFLRKGDEITLPVIVHNYLEQAKQVKLSLDVTGLDKADADAQTAPVTVTVPSKGDGTALWKLHASQVGTARLIAKAITDEESDALETDFPVEPVGVPKTLNGTGALSDANASATAPINFPANTDVGAHSLRIEVSPSIAGGMFSALDYLTTFPYGCTEQTMSSFLPNIVVAETLKKLNLSAHVSLDDLNAKVDAGLERLNDFQHQDGGWGWWKEDDSRVFMTAYVVSGLAEADHAGYDKSVLEMNEGAKYLRKQLEAHKNTLPDLRAYVVYALAQVAADTNKQANSGQNMSKELDTLWSRRNDLTSQGLAMLGLAMLQSSDARVQQVAALLEAKANHSGGLVSWPSNYNPLLDFYYDNNAESTAFALRFLSHADAQNPMLGQAAQWLVMNRRNDFWGSTEQTVMVLFGLVDYLAGSQELAADFDADVMVNGTAVGHRHFTAADAASGTAMTIDIPAAKLQAQGNMVQIAKHGAGKAYWSAVGTYYSTEQKLYQSGNLSLNVTRDYYKLVPEQQDGKILYRLDPLQGAVQPGDTLAVHLSVAGSQAKYLLVEDPIPAGTEFVQHEELYNFTNRPRNWDYWYTRREFHDDRAAIFSADFGATTAANRHESFYLLKVVNPGSFSISPAHAEPMYQPEIQATSDALHLQVNSQAGGKP